MNNTKKKILFVVEAMGGGVFTYIVDLANELSINYDVYIAYATRRQTPANFKTYFNSNIKLIEVKNFRRSINPLKDLKAFFEIKKIAKEIQPNIIHLHSSKAGVLGRLAFDGSKTPLFYTPHGYSFLMQNNSIVKRSIYKAIEYICAQKKCMTISCSKGEHLETLKLTNNATYVNNGININDLQNSISKLQKKDNAKHIFTVFTLGRICFQKNPELFNKIASALPNIKFLWIGDGELRHQLTASNIEITGWTDRKSALKQSMNGDIFILTSRWEGLPISLLEAMYMKKLCIVSNVIGNRDVIHNKINGYVCNTANEFIQAIKNYVRNHDSALIDNAHSDIFKIYNTKEMYLRYIKIYNGKSC